MGSTDMAYSRWNWLLLPVSLSVVYGFMAWFCWMPLVRADVAAKHGAAFVPYWEGQAIGFAATRLLAAAFLSSICFVMVPKRRWEPYFAGALIGLATSVLDQYSFNWINVHAGFLVALFAIPLIAGIVVILPMDAVIRPNQSG